MTWWKPWTWGKKEDKRAWEEKYYGAKWEGKPKREEVLTRVDPWAKYQRTHRTQVEPPVSHKPQKEQKVRTKYTRDETVVPIIVPMDSSSNFGFGSTPIFASSDKSWSPPTPDPVKGIQEASDNLDSTLNRASDAMDGNKWSGGGSGDYGSHSGASGSGSGSFDSGNHSSGDSGYSGSSSSSYDSGYSSSSSSDSSSSSSSSDSGSSSSGGGE